MKATVMNTGNEFDTEELLSRANSGDNSAINALFARHQRRLQYWCALPIVFLLGFGQALAGFFGGNNLRAAKDHDCRIDSLLGQDHLRLQ